MITDYDKELQHIADWLSFSVEFMIDNVSDNLDEKIESKRDPNLRLYESLQGMFFYIDNEAPNNDTGKYRFFKRNKLKATAYRIYRKEISINEKHDFLLNSNKEFMKQKFESILNEIPASNWSWKKYVGPLTEQWESLQAVVEKSRDEALQILFGDKMPLHLNGLIDQATWGGTSHNYNPYNWKP